MNLQDYMQIKEAAEFLGVAPTTLRNWTRSGKVPSYRNPVNRYRLYKQTDLEAILAAIEPTDRIEPEPRDESPTRD